MKIKLYFKALFGRVSSDEFKEMVDVLDYKAVAAVLRARRSYVNTIYWCTVPSEIEPTIGEVQNYTLIEKVYDEPMRRLLLYFGAKSYADVCAERSARLERCRQQTEKEKAVRKERGEEIVSKLIG